MLNYYPHTYTFNTSVTAFSKEVFYVSLQFMRLNLITCKGSMEESISQTVLCSKATEQLGCLLKVVTLYTF